ncbi:hypothetical protein Tco_1418454 [Tanacetum coccineum]
MPTEMELTLEQTQQGVSYEVSIDTSAGNPIKEILLNFDLPDHKVRSLTDFEGILKDGHGGTCDEALKSKNFKEVSVTLITEHFSRSDEVLKLKNFKKDASLKLSSYQIKKGYSQNSKAYIILNKHTMKIEESLNVTFNVTPPPSKTSPLVDDDLDEEEAIKVTEKKNLENDIKDETL